MVLADILTGIEDCSIDAKLYEELEEKDIYYESNRSGIERMRRTLMKILRLHPDGITFYRLQDEYDHIFHTLDDWYYMAEAIEKLKKLEYIAEIPMDKSEEEDTFLILIRR